MFRPLIGEEMATGVVRLLEHHITLGTRPDTGQHPQLSGRVREAQLDAATDPLPGAVAGDSAGGIVPFMDRLVINPQIRGGPRGREPVDADPRADLVVRPGVVVRPVVQFLVDPPQQPDRRVRQRVAQRLWLRALLRPVARALLQEPLSAF